MWGGGARGESATHWGRRELTGSEGSTAVLRHKFGSVCVPNFSAIRWGWDPRVSVYVVRIHGLSTYCRAQNADRNLARDTLVHTNQPLSLTRALSAFCLCC
ncbi:unnamed protein product, partial [Ectocarpus sp. 13 AM-2016]